MISWPFERRTQATFLKAELGFFGVFVLTWRQTPRRWGHCWRAGDFRLLTLSVRPFFTSWLNVGMSAILLNINTLRWQLKRECHNAMIVEDYTPSTHLNAKERPRTSSPFFVDIINKCFKVVMFSYVLATSISNYLMI